MRRDRFSFPMWWLVNVVAMAACVLGAVASSSRRSEPMSLATGCGCAFAVPIILIAGRKVSLATMRFVAIIGGLIGVPHVIIFGVLGEVVGGPFKALEFSLIMILMVGWAILMVAACQSTRPIFSDGEGH